MNNQELIKQKVVNHLIWDSRVDASKVHVKVDGHTVKLDGQVNSYSTRKIAEQLALEVYGVTAVHNSLEVLADRHQLITDNTQLLDTIVHLLKINSDIDASGIDVYVDHGKVTLAGSVPSFWEKLLAESETRAILGVVEVINKLVVVPTQNISDEALSEGIVNRLEQTIVNLDDLDIKVTHGQVRISGQVPAWITKQNVVDTVAYTFGVTDVDDSITVRPE